jgi:hypothetical protein
MFAQILVKERHITNRYSWVYLRFFCVQPKLMAAESNLGQFFVFGDCWFFVHLASPTVSIGNWFAG